MEERAKQGRRREGGGGKGADNALSDGRTRASGEGNEKGTHSVVTAMIMIILVAQ